MPLSFEWDETKAASNLAKHQVSFADATTIFGDTTSRTIPDPDHSQNEKRWITLGRSYWGKLLVVAHTDRGDNIRVISARAASRKERLQYEKNI